MKFLLFAVLASFYLNSAMSLNCYWNHRNPYRYFSSKTPYEHIRNDIRDSIVKPKGCQPISVWAAIRHGKRNPGPTFFEDVKIALEFKDLIIASYENGNSSLCTQDVDNLRNWQYDKSFKGDSEITHEGFKETLGLGYRLKQALPELLNDLKEKEYTFRPTYGTRMLLSAEAFIEGLENKELLIDQDKKNFSFAYPYRACPRYVKEVLQSPDIYNRTHDYMKTKDYQNMQERIERKLGLNFTLTHKNIIALYDLCRYTWDGIANKPSPWCAIFSNEDLRVLEYIGDLEHYSRNSYGVSQYSRKLGELLLADLLRSFVDSKNGEGKKIVSYFIHATVMDMVLVALNLFKDTQPLTGNYRDLNRKWRTTFTSTFSVNLIAVLYRCENAKNSKEYNHNIIFYWNEKPLLELCNQEVCSWQELETIFKPFLNTTLDFCQY